MICSKQWKPLAGLRARLKLHRSRAHGKEFPLAATQPCQTLESARLSTPSYHLTTLRALVSIVPLIGDAGPVACPGHLTACGAPADDFESLPFRVSDHLLLSCSASSVFFLFEGVNDALSQHGV